MFDKIVIERIESSGEAIVVTEGVTSELDAARWSKETKPEVDFATMFYLNDHDSRLYLASDTYVQLILGSGMIISGENQKAIKSLQAWIDDNSIEEKLEDGAYSYVIAGNVIFELIIKGKKILDIKEVDITTMIGAERTKKGIIKSYTQYVNDKDIPLPAKTIAHLKFSNRRQEMWGRALAQAIVTPKIVNGKEIDSAIEEMWKIENAMVKIFQSYASPMMMIQFEDVGEDFIKDKQQEFKKMGAGAKIITDKAFKAEIFEVNPASKFDKYIEHYEKNILEAGTQFATQIFTAGFTARASSESSTDMIKLKIKRIQRRYGLQLKRTIFDLVLKGLGFNPEKVKLKVDFAFDSESVLTIQDVIGLFEKGGIRRSELRKYLKDNTDLTPDPDDMDDTLPVTSVTPTDKMTSPDDIVPVPLPEEKKEFEDDDDDLDTSHKKKKDKNKHA